MVLSGIALNLKKAKMWVSIENQLAQSRRLSDIVYHIHN